MSFTEDELQAFNSILEQRFATHRQEMEHALDQRLSAFQQEIDRRLVSFQRGTISTLKPELTLERERPETSLAEKLREQQEQIAHALNQEAEERLHRIEAMVDRMLAAQLLGIEQLLSRQQEASSFVQQLPQQLEAIEVQTELSWEDLAEAMSKALDERLTALSNTLQHSIKELEQCLAVRLHSLQDEFIHAQDREPLYGGQVSNENSVREVLAGIEHLDRVMESMQVAMTANHALLSNRLYHHQQLPLERAHPLSRSQVTQASEGTSLLAQAKERIASGRDPQSESEETAGQ